MKTAVITGASRGIGLATAKVFLANGWKVVGTYNNTAIPLTSEQLISIKLDLSSPKDIERAAQDIKRVCPSVDVLVNNAGIIKDNHDSTIDLNKIRQTFEVNLFGTIDLTNHLLPLMDRGAHIINIDSVYGSFSFLIDDQTSAGYRMSKAALNMYTRVLALHLEEKGIIVSSLDPGWVKTDMGMAVATETDKPDREPEQAAEDIYRLATSNSASGNFWKFGKKREW